MKIALRQSLDKAFTGASMFSVLLIAASLLIVLGPMLWRGASAVVFRGTVEWRKLQFEHHRRGDAVSLQAQLDQINAKRKPVHDTLRLFIQGLDTEEAQKEARRIYRELGKQLANREGSAKENRRLRDVAQAYRDKLLAAYEAKDRAGALTHLDVIEQSPDRELLKGTLGERFLELATAYRKVVTTIDLSRRTEYLKPLNDVQEAIRQLFGPPPGEPAPPLMMDQYGATRWDKTEQWLGKLLWDEQWVGGGNSADKKLQKKMVSRKEQFKGTPIEGMLTYIESNIDELMMPHWVFYWQFFIDDSIPGHYFGGVGPEILGTLLLTVLSIVVALPLGVTAAAYLVECAGDSVAVQVIRTCINTLAGVPSIVFGLFGLAFFVTYLKMGVSIWAGSLTLAILVLPVVIRASEEAIRSVPHAYKEAALSLGASRFRNFVSVTLPAALPGILTGLILSMSRAAGETAPILFTAAVALGPLPHSLSEPTRTLSYGSYDIATGDKIGAMVPHQQYGMVAALVMLVLLLNTAAIVLRWRVSRKLRGG